MVIIILLCREEVKNKIFNFHLLYFYIQTQQSAFLQRKSGLQLFCPQTRSPTHSESESQSPCPFEQGRVSLQQCSVTLLLPPLHASAMNKDICHGRKNSI